MRHAAFITGGTGFVGGALLQRLTDGPRLIRALARDRTGGETVRGAGAEPVIGDLFEPEVLDAGMADAAVVFHVAGVNAMCVDDSSEMFRVNVEGSRNVVEAAARNGVPRVVYTSSAAVIGERSGVVATEDTPHSGVFLSAYAESKYEAERAVFEAGERLGVDIVSVNPSSVQGPGRASGSAELLLRVIRGRLPVAVDTHLSIVDVDDCAAAHVLAETEGVPGERYLINGASVTVGEAKRLIEAIIGRSIRSVTIPARPVRAMAGALGWLADRVGGDDMCAELLDTLLHGHRFDGSKAGRELGLQYTDLRTTLTKTIQWFVDYGFVPPQPNFPRLSR